VVINGHRNHAAIEGVAEEARSLGVRAITVLADVGDPAAVHTMVDRAAEELGSLDILGPVRNQLLDLIDRLIGSYRSIRRGSRCEG